MQETKIRNKNKHLSALYVALLSELVVVLWLALGRLYFWSKTAFFGGTARTNDDTTKQAEFLTNAISLATKDCTYKYIASTQNRTQINYYAGFRDNVVSTT